MPSAGKSSITMISNFGHLHVVDELDRLMRCMTLRPLSDRRRILLACIPSVPPVSTGDCLFRGPILKT